MSVSIYFTSKQKTYQGNTHDSIFEQGEQAGLILPHSCLGGFCGRCKAKLVNGDVKQEATDGLTDSEKKQGYILLCSSYPLTDVEIAHD